LFNLSLTHNPKSNKRVPSLPLEEKKRRRRIGEKNRKETAA
jgi:hypothetical protein